MPFPRVQLNSRHEDPSQNDISLRVHPEVQASLDSNQPVVALESTIIAHGMPFPENLQNAKALEHAVRSNGAIPATVAVINGIPHVGLSHAQLHLLATHPEIRKLSRRDLPIAFADGAHGATTVSATMFLSSLCGISVFATGGIGGVHRGVATTFDISADLGALASIPQLVICAGAKSILDIPKTLEALETASVPVLVLAHDQFPAFYTRDSGQPAPRRVESELQVAKIVHAAHSMRAASGVLLAVPVPERFEADAEVVQNATSKALREMETCSLKPNQVTPFLLKRIGEITDGASLRTNMHLARNNACVAGRVAVHLMQLRNKSSFAMPRRGVELLQATPTEPSNKESLGPDLLVVGGTALDIHCDATDGLVMGSSNAGRIRQRAGGVGKNIAEAAIVFGKAAVTFISCVGNDVAGRAVLSALERVDFPIKSIKRYNDKRTGVCCVVHNADGDLKVAVADFEEMFDSSSSFIEDVEKEIQKKLSYAKILCMDANFPPRDMRRLVHLCRMYSVPVWFEPTTSVKCKRVVEADILNNITYMSPNESELKNIARSFDQQKGIRDNAKESSTVSEERLVRQAAVLKENELNDCAKVLLQHANGLRIFCTRGAKGVRRFSLLKSGDLQIDEFPAPAIKKDMLRNTTGAGDCFTGRCAAGLAAGEQEDDAITGGIVAAGHCCMSEEIVPRRVFPTKL